MIELQTNPTELKRICKWLLVPERFWDGGCYIATWNSKKRRWMQIEEAGLFWGDDVDFLKYEEEKAKATMSEYRSTARSCFPRRRFQRVGARWLINTYAEFLFNPTHPYRLLIEKWGGYSPYWRAKHGEPLKE